MATDQDVEKCIVTNATENGLKKPLIQKDTSKSGSLFMVLLSTSVIICGSFAYGLCLGYSAPTQSGITDDLALSISQYAVFGSILNAGAIIGAIMSGKLADYIGRKGAMKISAGFCIQGWIMIYFAQGVLMLYSGRFYTGVGIGIMSYVVPVFIAEIAPKNLRGGLVTLSMPLVSTGIACGYIVGTFTTWQTLALIGVLPCLALLVGLHFIPESPRWLAKAGPKKEFKVALQRLRGKDADISDEAAEIKESIDTLESIPKAKMLDVFQKRYMHSVIVGVGLMALQQLGGVNAISFYASETFVSAGFSSGYLGNILMGCIQVPIGVSGVLLMDKSGRKPLLMVSASGTFVGCFLTGISFYLKGQGIYMQWIPTLALSGILIFTASFAIGAGVPWVMMSEIFPINIKGNAGSLVTLVCWSSSWMMTYAFNFLMNWSPAGTFFLYSSACAVTVLFVARVVPETKGRTLEEIQASMSLNCD